MSISKEELSRDFKLFRCDISNLQRTADNLRRRIDRLPDDPPKHEWKVDEWACHKAAKRIFVIDKIENGYLYDVSNQLYYPANCIPVHFIQTAESTIGEGSIVRTPEGWVGSATDRRGADEWFIFTHGSESNCDWYAASKLTLCAPEVK